MDLLKLIFGMAIMLGAWMVYDNAKEKGKNVEWGFIVLLLVAFIVSFIVI